jgi:hypothetical protein
LLAAHTKNTLGTQSRKSSSQLQSLKHNLSIRLGVHGVHTSGLTPRAGFCSLRVAQNFPLTGDDYASN